MGTISQRLFSPGKTLLGHTNLKNTVRVEVDDAFKLAEL